jgi:hypothetical protein
VRDKYLMTVADRCRIADADRLRGRLEELRAMPARERAGPDDRERTLTAPPRVAPRAGAPRHVRHGAELEALRLAVHQPETVADVLEPALFEEPVHARALVALLESPTLAEALEHAGPEEQELLYRLAVEEVDAETEPDDVVAVLVRSAAQRALSAIEADARATQSVIDLRWPKERIEALGDPARRVDAAAQLVAWLCRAGDEGA